MKPIDTRQGRPPSRGSSVLANLRDFKFQITDFNLKSELTPTGNDHELSWSHRLSVAAVNDVNAWSILAFVVAIVRVTALTSTALCLGLLAVFLVWSQPLVAKCLGWPELPGWKSLIC